MEEKTIIEINRNTDFICLIKRLAQSLGFCLYIVLIIICDSNPALARELVDLDSIEKIYALAAYTSIYEDSSGDLTLEDIKQLEENQWQHVPYREDKIYLGYSNSAYWLRFKVNNSVQEQAEWLLHFKGPAVNSLEAYVLSKNGDDDNDNIKMAGQLFPFYTWDFPYKDPLLILSIDSSKPVQNIYVRVMHDRNIVLHPLITTPLYFLQTQMPVHYLSWLYYGIIFAMALYNLLLFFFIKEKNYIYLSLAALSIGLNSIVRSGYAYQYLWPGIPGLNYYAYNFFTYVAVFLLIVFSRNFLATKKNMPRIDRVFTILAGITLFNLVLKIWFDCSLTHILAISTNIAAVGVIMLTALYTWVFMRKRNAQLFFIASFLAAVGIVFDLLGISNNIINDRFGLALQMILFSIVLADKVNAMRLEKEQAREEALYSHHAASMELERLNLQLTKLNIELEQKISERTMALEQSNIDLQHINRKLQVEIRERKKAEGYVKHIAYHDFLTDLPNRKLFYEQINRDLLRARRANKMLAIMYIDLDNFKDVNDRFGHKIGDQLLCEVARRLTGALRRSDMVARMGGDEFTILLNDINSVDDSELIAKKILGAFKTPVVINEQQFFIKASIGISVFPHDGNNPEILIRRADDAMYMAKNKDKNNYQVFSKSEEE